MTITGNEPGMPSFANFNEEGEMLNEFLPGCKPGYVYGLTIRQHFAMAAIPGLIASPHFARFNANDIAGCAVEMADALIAELNKTAP